MGRGLIPRQIAWALTFAAILLLLVGGMSGDWAAGVDGTVEIHTGSEEAEALRHWRHVCPFHVHASGFKGRRFVDWEIKTWPMTGERTTVLSGTISLDDEGQGREPEEGSFSLPDGRYKLFWDSGRGTQPPFWVQCPGTTTTTTSTTTTTHGTTTTSTTTTSTTTTSTTTTSTTTTSTTTTSTTTTSTTSTTTTTVPTPVELSFQVEKLNDADQDGTFNDEETLDDLSGDVTFRAMITNTGPADLVLVTITDAWGPNLIDVCAELDGRELTPSSSVTCQFTIQDYAPVLGTTQLNTVSVTAAQSGNPNNLVFRQDTSRVNFVKILPATTTSSSTTSTSRPEQLPFTGGGGGRLASTSVGLALLGFLTLLYERRRESGYHLASTDWLSGAS